MELKMTTISLGVLFFSAMMTESEAQECNTERKTRCRIVIMDELERKGTGLSTQQLEVHCKALRQNVDCLVWQVTMCTSYDGRERNGEIISRAWKYLQSVCDVFGGWWQNRCYQRDDVKRCERNIATDGGSSLSRGSCTEYDRFRDCVADIVKRRCEAEDSTFLGSYLLDKAKESVWLCPGNRQGSLLSYSNSAALSAESPFLPGCNAKANVELRGCMDRYQFEREQSQGMKEAEERTKYTCCASYNFRNCVRNAFKTYCFDLREEEAAAAVDQVTRDREYLCREHWQYQCSAAVRISTGGAVTVSLAGIVMSFAVSWLY